MGLKELNYRFENELWPINPMTAKDGSKEKTLIELQYQIASKSLDGSPLTFDIILNKYTQYFDYIRQLNVGREPRYQTKVLSIAEWLSAEKYREDVSQVVDQKDIYLYGE